LETWREETELICQQASITPVQDESNLSHKYYRNRIRLELLPYLEGFNPQVKTHILQTSRLLAEEDNELERIKSRAWQVCFDRCTDQFIALHLKELREQSAIIRRAVLRRAMWELEPERRDIDFDTTLTLDDFAILPSQSRELQLPGKIWAQINGNSMFLWRGKPGLAKFFPQVEEDKEYPLVIDGKQFFTGWMIEACEDNLSSARDAFQKGGFPFKVWLDADRLLNPLVVRGYQPGERFIPLGMDGKSQKLSDFWVNHKVPRQARKNWPLICSGQSIVWIPGFAVSEIASVTNQTKRVIRLCLHFQDRPPDDQV
jgi:tRNA(Ile)-lysidine synthase